MVELNHAHIPQPRLQIDGVHISEIGLHELRQQLASIPQVRMSHRLDVALYLRLRTGPLSSSRCFVWFLVNLG